MLNPTMGGVYYEIGIAHLLDGEYALAEEALEAETNIGIRNARKSNDILRDR